MSDQNSTTPDPSDAVPGYQPPSASEPAAPATPPAYTPPPAFTPPPAAEPPAYTPPPAPTGGYEPPAAGGYAPPPTPGYPEPPAAFPPPPPGQSTDLYGAQSAYPPPPPAPGAFPPAFGAPAAYGTPTTTLNIGDAVGYGWKKFSAAPVPFLLIGLIIGAVSGLVYLVGTAIFAGMLAAASASPTGEVNQGAVFAGLALFFVVMALGIFAAFVVNVGMQRAALDTVRGRPVTVGSAFRTENLGQYVLLYLLLVAAYVVISIVLNFIPVLGSILSFLLILAAGVLFFFAPYFILDKGMSAIDALKASYAAARANLGQVVIVVLVTGLIAAAGGVLCGVGAFVTLPLALIASAYAYLMLQGEMPAA